MSAAEGFERPPLFEDEDDEEVGDERSLASYLRDQRYGASHEVSLQDALQDALDAGGFAHEREFVLDAANRLDFLVGRVAVEVKVAGTLRQLADQIERYSNDDRIDAFVVVTTITGHMGIPGHTANGKPIEVVYVSSTNGRLVPVAPAKPVAGVGSIRWHDEDRSWAINAKPHVMIRVRRLFPRIRQSRSDSGAAKVAATPEVARDLEMLRFRYDLTMTDEDAARLLADADVHRDLGERIESILRGDPLDDTDAERAIALPPRWDCQARNAALIAAVKGVLIGDKLGRGKTYSGLTTLANPGALPAVIVCPPNITSQWERETRRFWPDLKVHVAQKMKPYPLDPYPDVLIVPYSKISGWAETLAGFTRSIILDEIQHLRNGALSSTWTRGSQRGAASRLITDLAEYRVGLSGTPVHNYGGDAYNVMSFLRPELLGTRDEFLREWCGIASEGKTIVRDPEALAEYLASEGAFTSDPGDPGDPPVRIEHVIPSDREEFDRIIGDATEMAWSMLNGADREARFTARGQFEMWMRRATGIAKAPYVASFVEMLLNDGVEKVLLVGYHREVYRVWNEKLGRWGISMYTGSESARQKDASVDRFMNGNDRILMMSLASGEGLDGLQNVCNVVVFGELDWSPAVPTQIIGRLDRPGQTEQVLAYFLTSDDADGCDPHMLNTLGVKDRQGAPFNNRGAAIGHLGGGDGPTKDGFIREMAERLLARNGGMR